MKELKQKVYKAIKPKCEVCGGSGECQHESHFISTTDSHQQECDGICKTCNGLGYILELEVGCEVRVVENTRTLSSHKVYTILGINKELNHLKDSPYYFLDEYHYGEKRQQMATKYLIKENLGKPLTLQDILLALSKKSIWVKITNFSDGLTVFNNTKYKKDTKHLFTIPLNKTPQEYDQDLIDKLKEIL